jgi:tetratricopeptide (TPR) repeat protein
MGTVGAKSERAVGSDGPRFALRFEDGRGLLSLAQPMRFAHGVLEALELSLGALRFPLDLSAGPRRFRTRRTAVRAARVRLDLGAVLSERVEEPYRLVPLAPRGEASSWALTDPFGTVAFDLVARMEGADLWLAIVEARSANEGPVAPAVRVLAAARAIGLELDETRGALRLPRVLSGVLLDAFVPCGWRVPDDRGVRLTVERAGPQKVVIRSVEPGEAEGALSGPLDPWEQARRLGPVMAAFARGDAEGAHRAWEALRERLGPLPDGLARAARGLYLALPDAEGAASGPQALTLQLRRGLRARDPAQIVLAASHLADVEPCDAVAVEALCAAADAVRTMEPADCVALLEKAVARRPRDARLTLRLVEALAQLGTGSALRAALELALAAREPGPDRGAFARDAAVVCALAQRDEDAAWLWHAAVEGLPHDARVLEGLARAEARAGRPVEALTLFDRAADAYLRDEADGESATAALEAAARVAEGAERLDVAEERWTRVAERAPTPARAAALARVRRQLGARSVGRAEDALLGLLESAEPASVGDDVVHALRDAAASASARGERVRASAFESAAERLRPSAPAHEAIGAALPDEADEVAEPELLVRAQSALAARDTAALRAALAAAERAGDHELALRIVDLALAAVGDGPARAALEAARARLTAHRPG